MKYVSTRGAAPRLNFEDVLLTGLASDGGLYVPESLPHFDEKTIASWAQLSYAQIAFNIMQPFVAGSISDVDLMAMIEDCYAGFRHRAVAPLQQLDEQLWVLELFHGPTLAFKDFALQMLGRLFNYVLEKRQQQVVVMGATSGDTGSAAIEGCRGSEYIDIFILHPYQRVSDVQRKQMTSVLDDNVYNIAVKGNFDDCQRMVKESFSNQHFLPEGKQLVAVNSINWARIMAQIVYYFSSAISLGAPHRSVSYSVPTGNFGDIFAAYLAKKMGLPIQDMVIATNENDILHRFIQNNLLAKHELVHTNAPSMDIMVSSNFERLLFDAVDRDGKALEELMSSFDRAAVSLSDAAYDFVRSSFKSGRVDQLQTVQTMSRVYKESGYLLDPHSAIAYAAAEQHAQRGVPMVALATAHPAKFPEAVMQSACAHMPELPLHMQDLFEREERYDVLDCDLKTVQLYMQSKL